MEVEIRPYSGFDFEVCHHLRHDNEHGVKNNTLITILFSNKRTILILILTIWILILCSA